MINAYLYVQNSPTELEWDETKRRQNRQDHGVDFAEVEPLFYDPLAIARADPDVEGEQRHILIGQGFGKAFLVVIYTWRGDRARIISARKASRSGRRQYQEEG